MATVVPIQQVIPHTDNFSKRDIRIMMDVLSRQGQIEPMQVQVYAPSTPPIYITFQNDTHAAQMCAAASQLGWTTLLITVMKRYEY